MGRKKGTEKTGGRKKQYFRRKARDEDVENLLCE
jgi:hypothetical protein